GRVRRLKPRRSPMTAKGRSFAGVTVVGAGSWGTALAVLLAGNGIAVRLWGRGREAMAAMARTRTNARYLPGITLPEGIEILADFDAALAGAGRVLVVVPSHAFPETLSRLAAVPTPPATVVWGTKGLAPGGGMLL